MGLSPWKKGEPLLDLHLLFLGGVGLGDGDGEDTVLEPRLDLVRDHGLGEVEDALESLVAALAPEVVLPVFLALSCGGRGDPDAVPREGHLDLVLGDAGKVRPDLVGASLVQHVGAGSEVPLIPGVGEAERRGPETGVELGVELVEEPVHLAPDVVPLQGGRWGRWGSVR